MERLVELVSRHRFTRNGYRTNTDLREENRVKDKSGRMWLRQGPYSNRRRADSPTPPMGPHRDGTNTSSESFVAFWGCPEGEGALVLENGQRFEAQRTMHACGDLSQITHWVEPHSSGKRYSVVCFSGPMPRVAKRPGRRVGSPGCRTGPRDQRATPPSRDAHPPPHRSAHTSEPSASHSTP